MGLQRTPFEGRAKIYQLFVRHFGNANESRIPDGSLQENGCGKFIDINDEALKQIKEMGFTHVWLTGILEHASGTYYLGREADPPSLLKGKAGSPYAIRDYYNVCPDYSVDPSKRLHEFTDLISRCQNAGLRVLIDLVPNHVSRSYNSSVFPEKSFGEKDQTGYVFHPDNNFFYLQPNAEGEGLKLPCGEIYEPESVNGRVTGNNSATWTPSADDWYETVKLNYGHDYTTGNQTHHLPDSHAPLDQVPDTWRKMDDIVRYWLDMGVDGFRVDMAHMVPLEFWAWIVNRARTNYNGATFVGEAYDDDPAKLSEGNILEGLIQAGFNAVYDQSSYHTAKGIYESGKWANDLADIDRNTNLAGRRIRYVENHDEVRVGHPNHWGGMGPKAGLAAFTALALSSTDALMVYNGQEFGERSEGDSGFSGDDGRTTIFDYWGVKSLQRWLNWGTYSGGLLREEEKALRESYRSILELADDPLFSQGLYYDLNDPNRHNPRFDFYDDESIAGGHWLLGFLRHLPDEKRTAIVVVNLNPEKSITEAEILLPKGARVWANLDTFDTKVALPEIPAAGYVIVPVE